jgi:hypothetical protein
MLASKKDRAVHTHKKRKEEYRMLANFDALFVQRSRLQKKASWGDHHLLSITCAHTSDAVSEKRSVMTILRTHRPPRGHHLIAPIDEHHLHRGNNYNAFHYFISAKNPTGIYRL